MSESTQERVTLGIREESVSNVIYEESSKFDKSISNEAYYQAFQITNVIVGINNQFRSNRKKDGTEMRNSGQFFNIIAFTGERGTGKTSVMLSYMEFLKDYYYKLRDKELGNFKFKDGDNDMDLMFTGLEYIDASLLGNKTDDVLRNVLPKMLKKWHDEEKRSYNDGGIVRDEDYSYRKRQIHMRFNQVYKSLRNLNSKQDILEADNDMFMETLENLSLTWNLRQSFQELVEDYLKIMEYSGSEKRIGLYNHFLVITIDDLDMNIEHGFELLEEIRKYLMVPNVIVLLSASYEQLEKLCIEHYTKTFKEIKGEAGIREYITKLSREYLEKMLPAHCQVLMEPVQGWKFYDQEEIAMEYTRINGDLLKTGAGTVQNIVQKQLIDYFDLKFSTKGNCLFYLIPYTTRELALWVRQIYSLEVRGNHLDAVRMGIKTDSDAMQIADYEKNLQWFWKEKLPRIFEKYLNQTDSVFLEIGHLEPDGQIATIKEAIGWDRKSEESLLELLGSNLMKGTKERQTFSALSIIYLTTKLTQLFTEWYQGKSQIRKEKALKNIKQYFIDGIWGTWEKKMACQIVQRYGICDIARIEFRVMNHCLDQIFRGGLKGKNKIDFIEYNKQAFKNYQYLLMFFNFSSDFNFSSARLIDEQNNTSLKLERNEYKGNFALSNIMRPWDDRENIIDDFLEELLRILGTSEDEKTGKNILNIIDVRGQDNNYISLPLENIEFLIHIGQKLQERLQNRIVNKRKTELIIPEIQEYFTLIRNCLEEYDSMYRTSYTDEFDKTQIGSELKTDDFKSNPFSLLYMLSESIRRVAVAKPYIMAD